MPSVPGLFPILAFVSRLLLSALLAIAAMVPLVGCRDESSSPPSSGTSSAQDITQSLSSPRGAPTGTERIPTASADGGASSQSVETARGQLPRSARTNQPNNAGSQNSSPPRPTLILPRVKTPASKEQLEQEAQFVVDKLQRDLPGQAAVLHVAALLNAQLHKTAEAVRQWERCIELDPDTEAYYINLAAVHLDRGEAESAERALRNAIGRGLHSPDLYHHLAVALLQLGKEEEAAQIAQSVLKEYPQSGGHWLLLGQAQLRLGQSIEAEKSLRKAIQLGSGGKSAYFALFNACLRNGKREDAMKFREMYLNFEKEEEVDKQQRYQVLSEKEARSVCLSVMSEAAALYMAAGSWKDAEHLLLRILALDPEHRAACVDLARIYRNLNQPVNELVVQERIAELDPFNLMNYLTAAKISAQLGNLEKAEAYIQLAISMAPQSVVGYSAMTDFLLEAGQPAKALWYIQYALQIKPSPAGFRSLARIWRALGDTQRAAQAEAQAAEMEQSGPTGTGDPQQ